MLFHISIRLLKNLDIALHMENLKVLSNNEICKRDV